MAGSKLGHLVPANNPEQAARERALYERIGRAFNGFCRYAWRFCGVPGSFDDIALAAAGAYTWDPADQAEFDRATKWFIDGLIGERRDPGAFSDPSTAQVDLHNPLYNGKPILPGELRTAYEVGIDQAVQLTGDDSPQLLGQRNYQAQQDFLRDSFARLTDGARVTIGDHLTGETNSVKAMLLDAMNEGQNPLKTARELQRAFRDVQGYQWARLARTETSFALNSGAQAEYAARGYVVPTHEGKSIDLPPYHPNCLCSSTIDVELGVMLPDVSAIACHICQSKLAIADMAVSALRRRTHSDDSRDGRPAQG